MPNLFSLLRGNRRCRALFTTFLVCLDHEFVADVDTKELEALNLLHYNPVDENGVLFGSLFPIVHDQLFVLLTLRERLLSWHHTAMSLTSSL